MQPPAQQLVARDLHDTVGAFRHIYLGQPKSLPKGIRLWKTDELLPLSSTESSNLSARAKGGVSAACRIGYSQQATNLYYFYKTLTASDTNTHGGFLFFEEQLKKSTLLLITHSSLLLKNYLPEIFMIMNGNSDIYFELATKAVETDHACNRFPHFLCASVTEEDSTIIIHTPFLWKKPQDKGQYAESFRDLSSKSNPSKSANNQMAETSNSDEALCHPYLSSCQIHHASNSFLFV